MRLSLDLSEEMNGLLEDMARRAGTTKSEVLRRSIGLMDVALQAKARGQRIGFANADQTLATEIVGF